MDRLRTERAERYMFGPNVYVVPMGCQNIFCKVVRENILF